MRFLPLLLSVLLLLTLSCAQTCELFAGTPTECAAVFAPDVTIFVPASSSQAVLLSQSPIAPYITLLSSASSQCASAALGFFCPSIFSICLDSVAEPVNRSLCRALCEGVFSACATEINDLGPLVAGILPNCTATRSGGASLYPEAAYVIDVNGTQVLDECFSPNVSTPNDACPEGLIRDLTGGCNFKCPSYLISARQFKQLKVVLSVVSVLAGLGWIVLILSNVHRYRSRALRWPHGLTLFVGVYCLLLYLAYWMGMVSGFEAVWCNNGDFATQDHKPCAVQGSLFLLGILGASMWLFWLSFNLVLSFTIPRVIPSLALEIVAHVSTFCIPIAITIVALKRSTIRYTGDFPLCVVGVDVNLFVYPAAAFVYTAGTGLLVCVGWVTYVAIKSGPGIGDDGLISGRFTAIRNHAAKALKSQWRLLVLATYTVFGLGYPIGVFLWQRAHDEQVKDNVRNHYLCLLGGGGSTCHPILAPPYPVVFSAFVAAFAIGIIYGAVTFDRELLDVAMELILHRRLPSTESKTRSTLYQERSWSVDY